MFKDLLLKAFKLQIAFALPRLSVLDQLSRSVCQSWPSLLNFQPADFVKT